MAFCRALITECSIQFSKNGVSRNIPLESASVIPNMSAVLKLWQCLGIVAATALCVGCASNSKSTPSRLTPLVGETTAATLPGLRAPASPPETNAQPKTVTPEPTNSFRMLDSIGTLSATNRWVPWESWSLARGLGKPQRVTQATNLMYKLRSTNGTLAIIVGNSVAQWNGLCLDLGFAPQFTNGQPAIHALDLVKNLDPLLAQPWSLRTGSNRSIVIDPGHGGENTGTRNVSSSRFEKEYTLDWALRLRPLLESNGWTVYLTRTNDVDVSSGNRVALADTHAASLFLSLHFNSSSPGSNGRGEHAGLETYCLTPVGMASSLVREFEDPRRRLYPNNAFDAQNLQLAARLHGELVAKTGRRDRGIRRARFMTVLQGQNRPAALIEAGYLSDPKEARLISLPEYRQKLAEAVAAALR